MADLQEPAVTVYVHGYSAQLPDTVRIVVYNQWTDDRDVLLELRRSAAKAFNSRTTASGTYIVIVDVATAAGNVLQSSQDLRRYLRTCNDVTIKAVALQDEDEVIREAVADIALEDLGTADRVVKTLVATAQQREETGNQGAALIAWRAIVSLQPDNANALFALAATKNEQYIGQGLKYYPTTCCFHMLRGELLASKGDWLHAYRAFERALVFLHPACKHSKQDVLANLALMTLHMDNVPLTQAFLQSSMDISDSHVMSLTVLAQAHERVGHPAEAIGVLLRAIISDSQNPSVRNLFGKFVKRPDGVELVKSQLIATEGTAPAYAFLATTVKDVGALDAAIQFLKIANEVRPCSSYALNLMHAHECVGQTDAALKAGIAHLIQIANGYIIGPCKSTTELARALLKYQRIILTGSGAAPVLDVDSFARYNPTEADLDLLAVTFTIVKMLFVHGRLQHLKDMCALIDAARLAATVQLHMTTVRNENAYFSCIHQLLDSVNRPIPLERAPFKVDASNAIYMLGDSHTLAGGWRPIRYQGQERILVPKLVTGVKAWHLRPESVFYPKVNFEHVSKSIPTGATVISMIGEIDCREGVLRAVMAGKYASLPEALQAVIDILMSVLKKLIKDKSCTVFVHPAAPVLNETRSVVMQFNELLRQSVARHRSMKYLDIARHMLRADGRLKAEYELDGTHLHPKYLDLVEAAMQ